jgi:hypothetical protein
MRLLLLLVWALASVGSTARAQRFGLARQMFPADADITRAIAVGDVDGDGDLDLLVGNEGVDRLYLGDGTGVFLEAAAGSLPATGDATRAVALGDVDGDGDLDLLVGNDGSDRLFLNAGTGIFADATATNLPAPAGNTAALALGDLDGDGDLDAYAGLYGQPDRLYVNGGGGMFVSVGAPNLPALGTFARAVALGDVDGDGDLDALLGNTGPCGPLGCAGEQNRLYLNGGAGVFTDVTATNLPGVADATRAVALGDVDGDGDLDVVAGNDGPDRRYENDGAGVFTDVTGTTFPTLDDDTGAVALADVDADGDLDALVGNGLASVPFGVDGSPNRLLVNRGTGSYTDATDATGLPILGGTSNAVGLGDVDGDGDLDAVVGNLEQDRLYLNLGTGMFVDVTAANLPAAPTTETHSVALGDVDGDGDLDVFAGGISGPDRLYLGDGTGVFVDASATNLLLAVGGTRRVAFGDVDADGDLDAFAVKFSIPNRLYLNDGAGILTGMFSPPCNPGCLVTPSQALALGDVDGNGLPDAFLGAYLFLNAGGGMFYNATFTNLPFPPPGGFIHSIALGDVDSDGDLDAFVGASGQCWLLENDGAGVFADVSATHLPVPSPPAFAVGLGDVDGDGDLDALLGRGGNYVGNQGLLYLNDGAGVFTDVTATELPSVLDDTRGLALGDLDGDGDLDALTGNSAFGPGEPDRVYTNLTRQLSWRPIPRIGKPLVLELRGPGNGTWILALSLGGANLPFPPFGVLRLDPATLLVVAAGGLDSQGKGIVVFPVPSSPALVRLSVFWQGVVSLPVKLTNLEISTLTSL